MELGLAVNIRESIDEIQAIVRLCKGSAIKQVWVTDYPATRYAPVVAASLAKEIQDIRFGIGLLSPLLHPVEQIKRAIKSLVSQYGERFDVLVGPGDRFALSRVGVDYGDIDTLVSRLVDDAVELRKYVSEQGLGARVFMAAQGPDMITESRKTDGVILNYTSVEHTKWAMSKLENLDPEFVVGVFAPTYVRENDDCVLPFDIKRAAAMVIMGLSQSAMKELSVNGSIRDAKQMHREKGYIDHEVIDSISDKAVQKFSVCTTEEGLSRYIQEMDGIGTDMIVFGPPAGKEKEIVGNIASGLKGTSR